MNPLYVPILKAKPGELKALEKLSNRSVQKMMPIFDLHRPKDGASVVDHLDKLAFQISAAWEGGPVFVDIAPNMNGKIRYTLNNRYLVVRGHSIQLPPKGGQTHALAQYVIDSGHYMGPSFSWGDQRIMDCSRQVFKGNAGDWIAIDTSHHVEAVLAEIFEFQRQVAILQN